jgi:hypothetical protein
MCLRAIKRKPVWRKPGCGARKPQRGNRPLRNVTTLHMCGAEMTNPVLPQASRTSARRRLDQLGIGLAGLCALHCLATLTLISVLGLGGHFLLEDNIHRIGLVLAVGVAAVAIGWGVLRHRRMLPFGVASAGLVVMTVALLVPHGTSEFLLTLVGVALVSLGHWLNLRAAR